MYSLARARPRCRRLRVAATIPRPASCIRPLAASATLASAASAASTPPVRPSTIQSAAHPVRKPGEPTATPTAPFPSPPSTTTTTAAGACSCSCSPSVPDHAVSTQPTDPKQSGLRAFRRLPVSSGMKNLLIEQLLARHALRLDQRDASPIQPSLIQRLSFHHFFDQRHHQVEHPAKSNLSWVRHVRRPGFFFPCAPGSSTLLAGETGGGKTLAYLLPLLQRLITTRSDSFHNGSSVATVAAGDTSCLAEATAPSASPTTNESPQEEYDTLFKDQASDQPWEPDQDEPLTEDELAALLEYEQEAANDPDHIPDEELDEFEADLLHQYDSSDGTTTSTTTTSTSSRSSNPSHHHPKNDLKGRFVEADQLSHNQSRAQTEADQVDQWSPKLRADPSDHHLVRPRSVILVPTHELARQVEAQVKALTYVDKVRTVCTSRVHWLSTLERDVRAYARNQPVRPIDVLVTTPERLFDLISSADQRKARWQALHRRYRKEGNLVAAEQIEKAASSDAEHKLLVSLDQVQAMVCDEADTLWAQEHFDATRHIVRSVYDTRIEKWRRSAGQGQGQGQGQGDDAGVGMVPADIVHVTATVDPGFQRQLLHRFPETKELRSKLVHRLPPNVSVKVAPVYPRLTDSFVNEVRKALLWDQSDRSRVLVVCELKRTVERFSRLLDNVGILNVKLTSEMRDRSTSSRSTLKNFTLDARKLLSGPPVPETKQAEEQETLQNRSDRTALEFDLTSTPEPDGQDVAQASQSSEVDHLLSDKEPSSQVYDDYDDVILDQEAKRHQERNQAILNGVDPLDLERERKRVRERTERNGSSTSSPHHYPRKENKGNEEEENGARVLLTTSHLTRGLDFSPLVTHVFIPDSYVKRNLHRTIDPKLPERHVKSTMELLHRAGRVGRLGTTATLVLFDKLDLQTGKPLNEAKGRSVAAHLQSATKGLKMVPFTPRKKEREWTLGDGADKVRKPVKFDPLDEGYAPSQRSGSLPSSKKFKKLHKQRR